MRGCEKERVGGTFDGGEGMGLKMIPGASPRDRKEEREEIKGTRRKKEI